MPMQVAGVFWQKTAKKPKAAWMMPHVDPIMCPMYALGYLFFVKHVYLHEPEPESYRSKGQEWKSYHWLPGFTKRPGVGQRKSQKNMDSKVAMTYDDQLIKMRYVYSCCCPEALERTGKITHLPRKSHANHLVEHVEKGDIEAHGRWRAQLNSRVRSLVVWSCSTAFPIEFYSPHIPPPDNERADCGRALFYDQPEPPAVRQSAGRDKSGGSFETRGTRCQSRPISWKLAAAPQLVKDLKDEELVLLKWYRLSPNEQKKAKKAGGEPNWNLVYSGRSIVLLLEAFFRGTAQEWERLKWNTDVFSLAPFKSSEWAEFVQQIHQAIENEEASPTAKQPSQQSAEEFGKAAFAAFHKEAQAVYPGMGAPPLAPAAAAAAGQATVAFGGVSATLTLQQAPEQAAAAATAEAKAAHASALSADFREALFFPLRKSDGARERGDPGRADGREDRRVGRNTAKGKAE